MADHDFLSCSLMVTTSNEFNFNLSMEYAPNWGHWVSTSNSFQWINPLLNWNYLFARIGFSTPKRKPSWINLHHFYSNFIFIFFNFLIMNKSSYFTNKKKKKKKRQKTKFSKKALGLGALGSYFLGCFQKKKIQSKFLITWKNSRSPKFPQKKNINQNFQFLEKIQDFQIFSKKKKIHQSKFSIPSKKFRISKFFPKKKKNPKFSIPLKNSSIPNSKKKKNLH